MKKSKGILFLATLVIAVMMISCASTVMASVTIDMYPNEGIDSTIWPNYVMNSTDLDKVKVSDDIYYKNKGRWEGDLQSYRYLEWSDFGSIPKNADIEEVILTFEVKRTGEPDYSENNSIYTPFPWETIQISIWENDKGTWQEKLFALEDPMTDKKFTIYADYINSADDVNNLKVRFRDKTNAEPGNTWHDLVEFTVKYTPKDETAPDTNVTHFTKDDGSDRRNCTWNGTAYQSFVNFADNDIVGNAISVDNESNIINIWYVRSGWAYWKVAQFGNPNMTIKWHTDPDDNWGGRNVYKVCGRAKDAYHNEEPELPVEQVPEDDCCWLCIDRQNPTQSGTPILQTKQNCVENYVNEKIWFSWTPSTDVGCAGISIYEVEIYYSNGTLYGHYGTSWTNTTPFDGVNGQGYYMKVRAWDKAYNVGQWSEYSEEVFYDTEDPSVAITAPEANTWFNTNFAVSEIDSDNLALWKCYYQTSQVSGWIETSCNQDFTLVINTYCPNEGSCVVYKKAVDNACNENTDSRNFNIDRTAPNTTKIVGDPKHPYGNDWYVTDHTSYTLSCDDNVPDGSGCNETYYRVNGGNWTLYTIPFLIDYLQDGQFTLEWYSTDNIGNIENTNYEVDFMDNTDSVTTKSVGDPKHPYGNDWYVTDHTSYTLSCDDGSGSGCYETYYQVNNNGTWILYKGPFLIDYLQDGQFTLEWYSSDNLQNVEDTNTEIDFMDNTAPTIIIVEPSNREDEFGCGANIFTVKASITDDGSGVNGATAELFYENGTSTGRTVSLTLQQSYWKGNINHWNLLAGDYYVKVTAWDNVANTDSETEDITLVYDVYFIGGNTFTVPKGQSGSTTFDIILCHGGNATGMIMSKVCGTVDLSPVLTYSTWAFDINQESYWDFFNHIFNWQSNVFLPLNNSPEQIGIERLVTLTVSVPSELVCNNNDVQCKYMGYKWGAAYEEDSEPADPSEDLFGIGWFGVQCNEDSVTFIGNGVSPPECINGEEKCEDTTYFLCEDSAWSNKGLVSGKCGYTTPGNRGGGGGGGSYSSSSSSSQTCEESWVCGTFGTCVNNIQFMSCYDQNDCGTTDNRPALSRPCTSEASSTQEIKTDGNTDSKTNPITGNVIGGSNVLYGSLLMICIIALAIVVAIVARRLVSKKA